jgi:rhodanese-related sulfurtransferase
MNSESVLISAVELADLLGSDRPPVVADVRWTLGGPPGKADFEASHIPGAIWVDLETQFTGPPGVGGRHPPPAVEIFEQAMRQIGVCQDSLVVAYDAANSQAASRLWWLLTDAGHRSVRVLNGGFAAWRSAGLPTASGPSTPPAPGDFLAHAGSRPKLDAAEIVRCLEGQGLSPWWMYARLSATPERTSQSTRLPAISRERSTCLGCHICTPTAGSCHRQRSRGCTPKLAARRVRCCTAAPGSAPRTACWRWSPLA